jgi:hypothetical protein
LQITQEQRKEAVMANIGSADRALRFAAGLVLIALSLLPPAAPVITGTWGWIALVVGLVLILTATIRFCPAYRLIGASTCKR